MISGIRRSVLFAVLLLLLGANVASAARDPEYDAILAAFKAKRYARVEDLARAFLARELSPGRSHG